MTICPECGSFEAQLIKDIVYPKGSVTSLLNCPQCERIVLLERLPQAN